MTSMKRSSYKWSYKCCVRGTTAATVFAAAATATSSSLTPAMTLVTSAIGALIALTALPLQVVTAGCDGMILRANLADGKLSPINDFSCANITRGQTYENWNTRAVKLPVQEVNEPDTFIAIDRHVKWPWYLKGMRVMVCNPVGSRPNITWPADGGYSPVEAHCAYENDRCPLGLEIYAIQYQSWWPFSHPTTL